MGRDGRQEALSYLIEQAEKQGYVTFDNIMDCADAHALPIQDFDWLSGAITTRGILVYDEAPVNRISAVSDDEDFDDYAQSDYEKIYSRIIELDESLREFVEEVRNIVPPQWREFSTLKYQVMEGNLHARERMIEMHLRIALKLALQRAETYDMDIQDAVGEACVGLIIAVDKYDPDVNGAFGSYASMWILQNISRRQPTRRPLMYYPVHKKDPFFSAYPVLKECGYVEHPDWFDAADIKCLLAERLSLSDDQIEDVIAAATPFDSYEDVFGMFLENNGVFEKHVFEGDDAPPIPRELVYEANIDQQIEERMLKKQLYETLDTLTNREKQVLELRYGLKGGRERTLEEVGMEFGVTRERIRQIEAKAFRKLKHPSRSRKLRDYVDLRPSEFNKDDENES